MILLQLSNLQSIRRSISRPNNTGMLVLTIIIILVVIIIIGLFIINRLSQRPKQKGGNTKKRQSFRVECSMVGLSREQMKFLSQLIKDVGCKQPVRLLHDPEYMQDFSKRALNVLTHTKMQDAIKEMTKSMLFTINRLLITHNTTQQGIGNTRSLAPYTDVQISPDDENWVPAIVFKIRKHDLIIETSSKEMHWRPHNPIHVRIPLKHNEEFQLTFETVIKQIGVVNRTTQLFIAHHHHITSEQKRRFPRRESTAPVTYWPISLQQIGAKKKVRAIIDNEIYYSGTVDDLSAGGCSIRTYNPLDRGTLIKMKFEMADGNPVVAFGRVRNIANWLHRVKIMHVKFTRISRKHVNLIQAYVHDML